MRGFLEQCSPLQDITGLNFGEGSKTCEEVYGLATQGGCGQCYLEACFASPSPGLHHHHPVSLGLELPDNNRPGLIWGMGGVSRSLRGGLKYSAKQIHTGTMVLKEGTPTVPPDPGPGPGPARQPRGKPGFPSLQGLFGPNTNPTTLYTHTQCRGRGGGEEGGGVQSPKDSQPRSGEGPPPMRTQEARRQPFPTLLASVLPTFPLATGLCTHCPLTLCVAGVSQPVSGGVKSLHK